jgi:hypothetical protein
MAHEERDRREWVRDRRLDDYGQADYSTNYNYDPARRTGYRAEDDYAYDPRTGERYRRAEAHERRTFDYLPERRVERDAGRRNGPSDRVLWAVIVERLEDERGLDLREVEVSVRDGEVFLDGSVRRKGDKRRIEDVADIDGVTNVQNNLKVRERHWGLF